MDINKIAKDFMKALDEHYYEYEPSVVRDIVEMSLGRKGDLIEMFRKNPNWDEEQLCIHFDSDIERKTDSGAVRNFVNWLWRETYETMEKPAAAKAREKFVETGIDPGFNAEEVNPMRKLIHEYTPEESRWGGGINLFDILINLPQETILPPYDEEMPHYERYMGYLNAVNEKFNFRPGMKINRVINKVCQFYGLDKLDGYNAAFATFSDGITPLTIRRHTTVSVNPVDFLLMSNGNSWTSCHYIGDAPSEAGCYSSGTISYMLGEDSFIVSIIDKEWQNDNLAFAPKINRQVFGYRDFQLLQSRLYPQSCDSGAREVYRNLREMVEEIITKATGETNRWVKMDEYNVYHDGTAYDDWWHFDNICSQWVLREHEEDTRKSIRMDKRPICIKCGYEHSYEENIVCEDCEPIYCADCGCEIDLRYGDSYVEDDGTYYCTDCRRYCHRCDCIERVSDMVWISDIDEEWCEWCASRYAELCTECGEWFTKDSVYYNADGEPVCDACKNEKYEECEKCGEIYSRDDMVSHDGKWYCESCYDDMEEEESA